MKFFPKKKLGQNFLTVYKILNMIANLGEISSNDIVLEVGPGTGNLTEKKLLMYLYFLFKPLILTNNLFIFDSCNGIYF